MNKRQFDDDSRALSAPVPCGSIVHAMPVSTTKIRASANRSSHPHHRNSQRFESLRCRHIHIAEPIWTDSLVRTRYSGSQRLEPFRNGRLHNRKPCFAGSTASHSPSKFTAIRVPVPPTYPHPEPRFDGSLADGRRSASQQSRAFSQPTSAHRKPCLAMRLLSLTVATHSESTLLAAAMPTSKPYTSGRHRASNRAKNPRHPPVCPKAPDLPRARVPLRFNAAAHRQKTQRFESLQRRPIHTRGRRPRPPQHDSSSKADSQGQSRGTDTTRETRLPLARIRSVGPICPHGSYITSYSNTPTVKRHPRHFSPQNRRPAAPLGYA